jgi:hypothetical protein
MFDVLERRLLDAIAGEQHTVAHRALLERRRKPVQSIAAPPASGRC